MRLTKKQNVKHFSKNKKTRKNRHSKKLGGSINQSKIFDNILSIGFEIETTDLIKLTLTKSQIKNNFILVNSSLTNIDLEYGFTDPDEYTYTKKMKDETFKITNDSAEDSEFNELIEKIYYNYEEDHEEEHEEHEEDESGEETDEEEDEEQENKIVMLKIPPNEYLTQTDYEIKFREPSTELVNFSSFTDTEYIATYYKPVKNVDVIKKYFFKSIRELNQHINKLVTIKDSKMIIKEDNNETQIPNLLNQSYVLPNTTLVYFNSSLYDIKNYNIREDLKLVIQCTFSCNVIYCYRIMKQLLSITNTDNYEQPLLNYSTTNKNAQELLEKINNIKKYLDYDEYVLTKTMTITNLLINNYNNKKYPLDPSNIVTKKIRTYLFLIIYKLFIYLNSYINDINSPGNMLKKHLSFAVRHNNYALFLELKKIINNAFFQNNNDNLNASIILDQLLDYKILLKLYDTTKVKNENARLSLTIKNNPNDPNLKNKYYGDPVFSIKSYFDYFDKNDDDWFVVNNIDEKSTKFDLTNDVIIIEFRDFPLYSYLELFSMGNNDIKNEILQNNVGTLSMKTLKYFINQPNS
jgi:hypothetical protein